MLNTVAPTEARYALSLKAAQTGITARRMRSCAMPCSMPTHGRAMPVRSPTKLQASQAELQRLRLHFRWPRLYSEQIQHGQEQDVLLRGGGVVEASVCHGGDRNGSDSRYADRGFE